MSHKVLSALWLMATSSSAQLSPVLLSHKCSRHPRVVVLGPWVCLLCPRFLQLLLQMLLPEGIFVFNTLPSTHIRTKPTALLRALRAMYFRIRTITPVHQYKFRLCCAQLCPTLCNPMDCSLPGSSVHGILQAGISEQVAISSRGSSRPRDWICSWIGRQILYHCATWEAPI